MGITERRKREKERRKEAIIAAAKKVFLAKGIEHTTMKEIAEEAELSKAALYLYFHNKEELTFEMLHISFSRIREVIDASAGMHATGYEKLENVAREFMRFYREQPEYIYFSLVMERYSYSISNNLPTTEKSLQLINEIQDKVVDLLKEGIADGSIRKELDAEKTGFLFLHMATSFMQRVTLLRETFGRRSQYEANELVEHMFTVFLYSLQ